MATKLASSLPISLLALFTSFFLFSDFAQDSKSQRIAFLCLVLICFSAIPATASLLSSKYKNCMLLDNQVDYRLYWNVSGSVIHFGIEVESTGWVALGISGDGTMNSGGLSPGSDIFMAFLNTDVVGCEEGCIHDYSTTVYNLPVLDSVQNLQLTSFLESNGRYYVEFNRALTTSDTTDRVIDPSQPLHIIYSTQTTVKPVNDTLFQKHNYKGSRLITFNDNSGCPAVDSIEVVMTLDVNPNDFDLNYFLSELGQSLNADTGRFSIMNIANVEPNYCPGFRIFYTSTLRPTDAGFLWLGMPNKNISIPAGHTAWHQGSECPSSALGGGNLTVFAYGMHMHYYGKQLWTEHYRNGTFIGYLGEERAYDFNDQHIVPIDTQILPGDRTVSHCIWDSTNAPGTIIGGESTLNEMCMEAIFYYPMIDKITTCRYNITTGCDYGVNC